MFDIEQRVFSRIKNKFPEELQTKFPNAEFSLNDKILENPKFPSIYVHELPSIEKGETIDGENINAILCTIEVQVRDNVSMNNVSEVMNNVVSTMKSMRFTVVAMPEFQNTVDLYRKVARFRRIIGDGDTL